jgi:hypothetical protein
MAIPNFKSKKALLSLAVLVIVCTGLLVYAHFHHGRFTTRTGSSADQKKASEIAPKSALGDIPAGVLTPNEFNEQSAHYLNKEVRIKGLIIKMSDGSYGLVDAGYNDAKGIVLYEATPLHLEKYAADNNQTATKDHPVNTSKAKPVIVTGTYTTDKPADGQRVTARFIATKVSE